MMKAEVMKQKKADNKGFSLVELIIVMAIMAILVGIVGTQAIPYMNRARESKDRELLSAINTAAVSAYTMNAESFELSGSPYEITFGTAAASEPEKSWQEDMYELAGYKDLTELKKGASSDKLKEICDGTGQIDITLNLSEGTLTVSADGFEDVVSQL